MTVVVGVAADALGAASQLVTVHHRGHGRNFDVRREYLSVPSSEYRSVQRPQIVVDVDHDRRIGEVKLLERTAQKLYAVCEIDGSSLDEGPWYFSPEIAHHRGKEIELRGLAVTRSPASVALGPLSAYAGTLAEAARQIVYQDGHHGELIKRAREYDRQRKHGEPIVIQGEHKPTVSPLMPTLELASSSGRVELRSATPVDVHRTRRELDLIVMPAEHETRINERHRSYTETFSHGAFAGAEKDPARIRVNRDHVRERVIGKALSLDPWAEEGLVGTVKLARTRLADESLELAAENVLDVSAGFAIKPGGEQWRGSSHRRVHRAVLDHISLVPQPAYENARVTAVRQFALPRR